MTVFLFLKSLLYIVCWIACFCFVYSFLDLKWPLSWQTLKLFVDEVLLDWGRTGLAALSPQVIIIIIIKKIRRQTHNTIANLARTTAVLPLTSRRTLYDALVTPHLNYCDIVWDGISKKLEYEIQKTGNFGARILLGEKKRSSATAGLIKLNMMPLCEKRKVHMGVFVHKILNQNGPKETTRRYGRLLERDHRYETRTVARGDLKALTHRTARYDASTLQRAVRCWNSIPFNIRQIDTTSNFKRTYQKFLMDNFKKDNACCQRACQWFLSYVDKGTLQEAIFKRVQCTCWIISR